MFQKYYKVRSKVKVVGAEEGHVTSITWLYEVVVGPAVARWSLH